MFVQVAKFWVVVFAACSISGYQCSRRHTGLLCNLILVAFLHEAGSKVVSFLAEPYKINKKSRLVV
jgi:hypothetical protein